MHKYLEDIDLTQYLRDNPTLFKINAHGKVFINYCEPIKIVEGDDEQLIQYKLIGA